MEVSKRGRNLAGEVGVEGTEGGAGGGFGHGGVLSPARTEFSGVNGETPFLFFTLLTCAQ